LDCRKKNQKKIEATYGTNPRVRAADGGGETKKIKLTF